MSFVKREVKIKPNPYLAFRAPALMSIHPDRKQTRRWEQLTLVLPAKWDKLLKDMNQHYKSGLIIRHTWKQSLLFGFLPSAVLITCLIWHILTLLSNHHTRYDFTRANANKRQIWPWNRLRNKWRLRVGPSMGAAMLFQASHQSQVCLPVSGRMHLKRDDVNFSTAL